MTTTSKKSTIAIKINIKETWKYKIVLKENRNPTRVYEHKNDIKRKLTTRTRRTKV